MYIKSLFAGIILFIVMLTLHILIWRVRKPEKHITALVLIFLYIPALFFTVFYVINNVIQVFSFAEYLYSALLYFSLACAYIQTYPAVYVFAPSLQMVYLIGKSGSKGLKEKEILESFDQNNLLSDRINDLLVEDFIYTDNNQLYLRPKGKVLAEIYYLYRKIYGLGLGNG